MNTLFVGQQVIRLRVVDSTNNYAAKMVKMPKWIEGTAIVADYQTSGKGRNGNVWRGSAGDNLFVSFLFKPTHIPLQHSFLLSMAAALAVQYTIKELLNTDDVTVKWPNDVFVNDRKVSGILIENQVRGGQISSAIVGIGINVNELEFGELRATSLNAETGSSFDREDVLQSLSRHLEAQYLLLRSKSMQILENYQASLYGKDEIRNYIFPDGEDQGVLQRVAIDGSATFARNSGKHSYTIDHVKWCWED
ncbi:MAG: biotin--[acetyl-CoA-carboxylase] ligase [Flavobacteriales bacterium]|nr:biotin--[acetyl-CoA-carboxylase] ligase [Flavobacteriales bacterium]